MASDVYVRRFLAICFGFAVILCVGSDETLYGSEDSMIILNANNFYDVIPGAEHAWFVEFYSSWCGHCIRFAPEWRQLAKEVKSWKPVIQLAVVDCAQEENLKLCRDFNVESYPALKWMDAFSKKGSRGEAYDGLRGTKDMKHAMIEHLQNTTGSPSAPTLLPKLAPLTSLEEIWNEVKPSTRFTTVIFEESHCYIGRELILDFASQKELVLRRMTKDHISKFGIQSFPSLFLIEKQGTFNRIAQNLDRGGFVKALNTLLGIKGDYSESEVEEGKGDGNLTQAQAISCSHVHMVDLESGLHYSLKQEVASHKDISGEKLDSLKSYIRVLAKYFPGRKPVVNYLSQISKWIDNEAGPLTGGGWLKKIKSLQEEPDVLSREVEWRGCQGSVPKYRGYPCSLWLLFHTLTVNSVIDAGNSPRFNHLEVLLAMRGYIKAFFGCRECSRHFMKMAVSIEEEVTSPEGSILWLWRAHNKANLRLHGDITEDPAHLKVQFPPPSLCQLCHHKDQGGKGSFDEKQVLSFLKERFAEKNINNRCGVTGAEADNNALSPEGKVNQKRRMDFNNFSSKKGLKYPLRKAVLAKTTDERDSRIRRLRSAELETRSRAHHAVVLTHWGLNTIDISLCVLFYIVCCGIIILVYWHLNHNHRINIKKCTKGFC